MCNHLATNACFNCNGPHFKQNCPFLVKITTSNQSIDTRRNARSEYYCIICNNNQHQTSSMDVEYM